MGYVDDYNDRNFDKIPYDDIPISRRTDQKKSNSSSSYGKGKSNKAPAIKVLMVISIVFIILNVSLILTTFVYIRHSVVKNVNNYYPSIASTGQISTGAVNTAVSSSVAIACGATIDSEAGFYNKAGMSRGSGNIIKIDNDNVYIITCYHVIRGHENMVYVLPFNWNVPVKAKTIGYSSQNDVAVLKVEKNNILNVGENAFDGMSEIIVADSRYISIGETVFAVGNSLGEGISASSGIVSTEPTLKISTRETPNVSIRVFQISAEINRGDSGGGVFDIYGRYIGLINAKTHEDSSGYAVQGMSYAIPSSVSVSIAKNIIQNNGKLYDCDIGVNFEYDTKYGSQRVLIDQDGKECYISEYYCVVSSFNDESIAEQAGLAVDDYIVSFSYTDLDGVYHEDQKMFNKYSFDDVRYNIKRGTEIKFKVVGGALKLYKEREVTFTVQ